MRRQIIKKNVSAREELARGAEFLADIVGGTVGPYGYNVFLSKGQKPTNDGVSIAREVQISYCVKHQNPKDCDGCSPELQNLGANAIREPAIKTCDEVGDGTTTATILAWNIYKAASKYLSREGVIGKKTPAEIVKQIEKERDEVLARLQDLATPIKTEEDLINSAIVSTENTDLGTLIGKAQWEIGPDGYLLAEETTDKTSSTEKVIGIRIDNGFGTSMIINNQQKQTLEVDETAIILTSYTLKDLRPLEPVINQLVKSGRNIITVIARAWTEEGIKVCVENINNGSVKIYPLNAPYTDMNQRFLDLAAVTGATFFDSEGSDLSTASIADVGFAKRITARRFDAIITGHGDEATLLRIKTRLEQLERQLEGSGSEFEKKLLRERIAQLKNGFAVVKVGSYSDLERKRLFDKAEDAVNAVRVALQEGTVPGAGLAFKAISDTLPDTYLLKRPLMALYEQIGASAPQDFTPPEWVKDPVKVLKVALTNACGAAASLALAGGAIATKQGSELDELFGRFKDNS